MNFSHFGALTTFSFLVSIVFALITKNTPREQLRYGVFVFFGHGSILYFLGTGSGRKTDAAERDVLPEPPSST